MTRDDHYLFPCCWGLHEGRMSEDVARFMLKQVAERDGIQTDLIDIRAIPISRADAGEAVKDSQFSQTMMRAEAIVLVVPEYNHGYPGLLKHILDTNLKEYIHKAVGICGVSAGGSGRPGSFRIFFL